MRGNGVVSEEVSEGGDAGGGMAGRVVPSSFMISIVVSI
jgi:hypothetical protein